MTIAGLVAAAIVAGMRDPILTKPADIGDLKAISPSSTLKYQNHLRDLKQIGRQQLGWGGFVA